MEISAPHLESFVNHKSLPFDDGFYNVSNINDAYICSDGWEAGYYEPFERTLAQLSHIKVLTISSVCVATLLWEGVTCEGYPLELSNLQELQLVFDHLDDEPIFYLFTFFSACPSPFLEKLFIKLTSNFEKDDSFLMTEEPDIVFENLSWIKITNFGGSPPELKMVKFLLKKAIMLDSIFIVLTDQCDMANNSLSLRIIRGQLSVIPKASKDARIVICGPLDSDRTINPTHTTLYYQEKYRNGTTVLLNGYNFSLLDEDFL
ncbi:F-box protein [Rhynchospora pubera]|uniref:F-box protein n=1 Tax=Rhynchospora pubera TaxID=906938 RepID=A0AAV8GXN9_9POAL|nr:F-box protein [Rhynchospora pubera]